MPGRGAVGRASGRCASCSITNTAQPATLTLAKKVDNTNGGTAAATDWTLSATGPSTISGASGAAAVTGASVKAGAYTLAESSGPSGYNAGAWSCIGGTLSGSTLTLGPGQTASCGIVNTARL